MEIILNANCALSSAAVKIGTPSSAQGLEEIQVELIRIRQGSEEINFPASPLRSRVGLQEECGLTQNSQQCCRQQIHVGSPRLLPSCSVRETDGIAGYPGS